MHQAWIEIDLGHGGSCRDSLLGHSLVAAKAVSVPRLLVIGFVWSETETPLVVKVSPPVVRES